MYSPEPTFYLYDDKKTVFFFPQVSSIIKIKSMARFSVLFKHSTKKVFALPIKDLKSDTLFKAVETMSKVPPPPPAPSPLSVTY